MSGHQAWVGDLKWARMGTFGLVWMCVTLGGAGCADDATPSPSDPRLVDLDGDGVLAESDCDDDDPLVSERRAFYRDFDGDGLGDGRTPVVACEAPQGFVANADDPEPECATNDTDECGVCGGPGGQTFYADVDRDGLGDVRIAVMACLAPQGFVANADDLEPECATNDTDECGVCAGQNADKDCQGVCFGRSRPDVCGVCDGPGRGLFFADLDGDGLGDPNNPVEACEASPGIAANADDLEPECATNDTDECGVCAGQNADKDCEGVCDGEAFEDLCGRCVGGTTDLEPATEDTDDDGTPDLCDEDCLQDHRLIIQWDEVPAFNNEGGPYTFQVILTENGDIAFQYGRIEPYELTPTVGIQSDGGEHSIEFGFDSAFALEQPAVVMWRDRDDRFIADYAQPLYWLDISERGDALELADDQQLVVPIGFEFPFYDQVYTEVAISSNGYLAFSEPYAPFGNTRLPNEAFGALIAPMWDDLNPARAGQVRVFLAPPTCALDCNEVLGGFGELEDECGTCLTGLEDGPLSDCNGDCGGEAFVDGCGICAGGDTGIEPQRRDCTGLCGGEAFYDDCRVCVGGDTGLEPTPTEECPQGVDLLLDEPYMRDTIAIDTILDVPEDDCLIQERCLGGGGDRKVIRFGTRIANIGTEDLRLGAPSDEGEFWHFDECHSHFHYEAYAAYSIVDVERGESLDIGSKNGFCVMDTGVFDPNLAPDGCNGYACGDQGISVGCQDTYGPGLQCQWIDVTGLPDGLYELIATTNPEREIPEINYENNSARVRVRLEGDEVTVVE